MLLIFLCLSGYMLQFQIVENTLISVPIIHPSTYDVVNGVPLCLYRTSRSNLLKCEEYEKCYKSWYNCNPSIQQLWFNDDVLFDFMDKYVPDKITNAFNAIKPFAYKADIWRLCILFLCGGIYADDQSQCNICLTPLIKKCATTVVNDCKENGVHNGFIITPKGSSLILDYLQYIIENIEKRSYGDNPLDITGPKAFEKSIGRKLKVGFDPQLNANVLQHVWGPYQKVIDENGVIILYKKYSFGRYLKEKLVSKNGYHKMWNRKDIYVIS